MNQTWKLSEINYSELEKMSGVYKIVNNANGNFYIGCSMFLSRRLRYHYLSLRKGNNMSKAMQKEFNESGGDFSVVIICSKTFYNKRGNYMGVMDTPLHKIERLLIEKLSPAYNTQFTERQSSWCITSGKYRKKNTTTNHSKITQKALAR